MENKNPTGYHTSEVFKYRLNKHAQLEPKERIVVKVTTHYPPAYSEPGWGYVAKEAALTLEEAKLLLSQLTDVITDWETNGF